MSISKIELRAQIKLLRAQLSNLEVNCREREDKMLKVLMAIEPFLEVLTMAQQKEIEKELKAI